MIDRALFSYISDAEFAEFRATVNRGIAEEDARIKIQCQRHGLELTDEQANAVARVILVDCLTQRKRIESIIESKRKFADDTSDMICDDMCQLILAEIRRI